MNRHASVAAILPVGESRAPMQRRDGWWHQPTMCAMQSPDTPPRFLLSPGHRNDEGKIPDLYMPAVLAAGFSFLLRPGYAALPGAIYLPGQGPDTLPRRQLRHPNAASSRRLWPDQTGLRPFVHRLVLVLSAPCSVNLWCCPSLGRSSSRHCQ